MSLCLLVALIGVGGFIFVNKENRPEPTKENLEYINSKFEGFTLEESIQKIKEESDAALNFSGLLSRKELYDRRENITSDNTRYEKKFSHPSPKEYDEKLNDFVENIYFDQFFYYGYSVLQFNIPKIKSKGQPSIFIEKITYMDGSEEVITEKLKSDSFQVKNQKTIKSINIKIKYDYVDDVVSYSLSNKNPKIVNEHFSLNLAKVDKNYLSYTLDGELDIIQEDVANKNGDILAASSCHYGYIGYSDEVEKYFKNLISASKKHYENKESLIKEIASYYQYFEQETNKMNTYKKECTFKGMPEAVTIYAAASRKIKEIEKTLTPSVIDLYSVVEDEETNTYYIIDQSGKVVLNHGNQEISLAGINYFYTENESEIEKNRVFKLNADDGKLKFVANAHRVISLTNNAILIVSINNIQLMNINNKNPIIFEGNDKSSSVNVIKFDKSVDRLFSFTDNEGTHIINDTGNTVLPLAEYNIDNGGNNTVKVSLRHDSNKIKQKDRKIYFLNPDGSLFLSITGYDNAQTIKDGMIMIEKNDKYGFIDLQGIEVITPIYEDAKSFNNGYAWVKQAGLWGIINNKGGVVIPFKYEQIRSMSSTTGADSYSIDGDNYLSMRELIENEGMNEREAH